MHFRRVLLLTGVFATIWAAAVRADGPFISGTTYTFATVDSVTAQGNYIYVTGILKGEATASTHSTHFYYPSTSDPAAVVTLVAACERKALLAMSKPGQYLLALQESNGAYSSCTLTRVNP